MSRDFCCNSRSYCSVADNAGFGARIHPQLSAHIRPRQGRHADHGGDDGAEVVLLPDSIY